MPNISDIILKCEERENMMPNEGFEEIAELLQSLLDQPEGEPVATIEALPMPPGILAQSYINWIEKCPPVGTKLFTHPPLPLKMLDDGYIVELLRVSQKGFNNSTAYQLIQQAFCAKNNLKLEKL